MLSSSGHSCLVLALEIRLRQLQVHRVISGLHARVTLPWNTYQASYVVAVQGRFHVNLQPWNTYQAPYVVAVQGRFHVNLHHHPRAIIAPRTWAGGPAGEPPASSHLRMQS